MNSRTPSDVIDDYLVLESQAGAPEAFRRLFERWHPRLLRQAFRYARSVDAARDITQESWMAIVKGISGLSDAARFRPWAYRIVANKARDWVRREQAQRRAMTDAVAVTDTVPTVQAAAEHTGPARNIQRIREGIERLEPEQRLILTWFYLEEMALRDIAEALSIPVGTVKSRLFHARAALRAHLMEEP